MTKGLVRSISRGPASKRPITNTTIKVNTTVTVSAAGAAVGFGTTLIGSFPEGNVMLLGAVASLSFSAVTTANAGNVIAAFNGDFAIGSLADANGTLAGNEINIISSTALGPAAAKVTPYTRGTGVNLDVLDNTAKTLGLNLNVLVDAADITDSTSVTLTVVGTVDLAYVVLGDD